MLKFFILILSLKAILNTYILREIFTYYSFNPNILFENESSKVIIKNAFNFYSPFQTQLDFDIEYEAKGPKFSESRRLSVYVTYFNLLGQNQKTRF
jgi:hypothetical protein